MTTSTTGTSGSSTTGTTASGLKKRQLSSDDFIKMMLTQLQHQDPMQPASNQELMAQMSQIGQLQSTTQLQSTLTGLSLQNQIGSGANLIGKEVAGIDANDDNISGIVTAVRVKDSQVSLELHNGKSLALDQVTSISPAATAAAGTGSSGSNS